MASYTFYYFFSILSLGMTIWVIVNMLSIRLKGGTLYGMSFRPGTIEHKRLLKLASNRAFAVMVFLAIVFLVNLVFCIIKVLQLNTPDSHFLLWFAPTLSLLLMVSVNFYSRYEYGGKVNRDSER